MTSGVIVINPLGPASTGQRFVVQAMAPHDLDEILRALPSVAGRLSEMAQEGRSLVQLTADPAFAGDVQRLASTLPEIETLALPQFQNPSVLYSGAVTAESVAIFLSEMNAAQERDVGDREMPLSRRHKTLLRALREEFPAFARRLGLPAARTAEHAKLTVLSPGDFERYRTADGGLPPSSMGTADPVTRRVVCRFHPDPAQAFVTAAHEFIHCAEPRLIRFDIIPGEYDGQSVDALCAHILRSGLSLYDSIFASAREAITELVAHAFVQRAAKRVAKAERPSGYGLAYTDGILALACCVHGIARKQDENDLAVWDRAIRAHLTHDVAFYGDLLKYLGKTVFRDYAQLFQARPRYRGKKESGLQPFYDFGYEPRLKLRFLDDHIIPLIDYLSA